MHHGEDIAVRCGRWRTCPGCAVWKQWTLAQRFVAGIERAPQGRLPMFVTLTFPAAQAPDEDAAHAALRSLVGRLRYRGYLGAYGWVLQRTRKGTLHYHGIFHLPWFRDGLAEWRDLIVKSGFGIQNRLEVARRKHAGYCARYISTRAATLGRLRRAYGFSRDFPRSEFETERALLLIRGRGDDDGAAMPTDDLDELAHLCGVEPDPDACAWVPSAELRR